MGVRCSVFIVAACLVGAAFTSCTTKRIGEQTVVSKVRVKPVGPIVSPPKPPLGLPAVPVPESNPMTAKTVSLGHDLFFDKRLSFNNTIACASCHEPGKQFTDGRAQSLGAGGKSGVRNAPTLMNAAYQHLLFWDGRATTLEEQVGSPMKNAVEMNQPHDVAVSKLNNDPAIHRRFEEAFGPGPVTIGKIEQAIASYERTLVSGDSAFDRFQYGGAKSALSPSAKRGLAVFLDPKRGNCAACHLVGKDSALFTDGLFHNIGVGVDDQGNLTDLGRYDETKRDADRGAFKTPTLRNVAETAPYMHDGRLKTLQQVVDFYAGHGNSNPHLDPRIAAIQLSGQDRRDLVAFLESLTSQDGSIAAKK